MSLLERNQMQIRMAGVYARRHSVELLVALEAIRVPFASLYPLRAWA